MTIVFVMIGLVAADVVVVVEMPMEFELVVMVVIGLTLLMAVLIAIWVSSFLVVLENSPLGGDSIDLLLGVLLVGGEWPSGMLVVYVVATEAKMRQVRPETRRARPETSDGLSPEPWTG